MRDKADWLKTAKVPDRPHSDASMQYRLPPGQTLTEKFPILHEGPVPEYEMNSWTLRVFGEVEEERIFSLDELKALPQSRSESDIHCVTRWSKFDTRWEGVKFRDFMKSLRVLPEAKYVMIHADTNYETNLPLEDLLHEDVLLAFNYDDKPLTPKHGYPLRLVVPHLYFWKSAKWVRGIEFMKEDRKGFWESHGFHNTADPFKEQRFSSDEYEMPEGE
ncbi:sulfite oxidase-like oxidoreductase [Paenibacillus sp. SN-8-1]|uniref:sulfite oxidase-like oxidoreductase n=1 Tax=Paenibacillus sp. SN-8-1 TaxID=3435409 RepID=UPI003D9A6E32